METERIALSQRDRDRLRVLHEVQQAFEAGGGRRGAEGDGPSGPGTAVGVHALRPH